MLGSLVIFFKIKEENINCFITFCLCFSVSVMILISILDLIPESSLFIINKYGQIKGLFICLATFLSGGVVVTILTKLINKSTKNKNNNSLYKVGLLSMLTLICHNFPEGILTFMASYKDLSLGISLAIAIMFHNIPEGLSIAVPIYYSTKSKKKAIKHAFLSGLAEPIGAISALIFLNKYINDTLINITLILVAGLMIFLSINELYPKALEYKEAKWGHLGLISGVLVIIIQHFIL